jgi:Domain of unknown function (DUF5134)
MSGAPWLRWSLATVMIAIALYHGVRLVAAHRRGRHSEADVDLTHAAMGSAMAMMLFGALSLRTSHFWAMAFTAPALWFVLRALLTYVRRGAQAMGHPLRQAVLSVAMLFMLLAAGTPVTAGSAWASMQGMTMTPGRLGASTPVDPAPTLLLVAAVAAVAIWTAAALRRRGDRTGCAADVAIAPRMTAGCQLAMNVTTIYMLLLMV